MGVDPAHCHVRERASRRAYKGKMSAPEHAKEQARLAALARYDILDSPPEESFDEITRLAAHICGTPVSVVTLVDEDRQWFKSAFGTDLTETPRKIAFCNHALDCNDLLVVPDLGQDGRFSDNPLVTSDPHARFYAGMPLITHEGHALGTLCVIDSHPRELSSHQLNALRTLGRQVVNQIELRRLLAKSELAKVQSERRWEAIFESAAIGVDLVDRDGRLVECNRALQDMLGYTADELRGFSFGELSYSEDRVRSQQRFGELVAGERASYQIEKRFVRKDGTDLWANVTVTSLRESEAPPEFFIGTIENITERKRLQEQLEYNAFHDSLTGLFNRSLFENRLAHARSARNDAKRRLTVLFIDLDDFKGINDSHGHAAGDQMLIAVAGRLRHAFRPTDTIARFGGDEFAVLLGEAAGAKEVRSIATRTLESLRAPFGLGTTEVFIRASMGVATTTAGSGNDEELVRNADTALRVSKGKGKGRYEVFRPSMRVAALKRAQLNEELQSAVEAGQFVLHYQPMVRLDSGRVAGMEALLRWRHPVRGLVGPHEFITLAEETGLILAIGGWVLTEACRQAAAWQKGHPHRPPLGININLSARQVHEPGLARDVGRAVAESGVEPRSVTLEITESLLVLDDKAVMRTLRALKKIGVSLAIDDFGTGYSSLSYLRRFPIDGLKIDMSFTAHLGRGTHEATLAEAIVALGDSLHLKTVAEGIETKAQLRHLQRLRCELGQGYYFASPQPAEEVTRFLSTDFDATSNGHSSASRARAAAT